MSRVLFWIFVFTYLTVFLDASQLAKAKIVYPRLIQTRNSDSELTLFINDDITLSLQPADIFPDEFLLQYEEGETPVKEYIKGADLRNMVFYDKDQGAAVSLEQDD
uniref:Putative metalloprotease n=1 Tax=Ixodes ricinus TaxID=34613 RepID=A0A0K8RCX4_IXORI